MKHPSAPLTERRYTVAFVLVTSLFFMWALGVNLNDILIPHLKKAFRLTDLQSSLIQSAFFGGYFLAALPAGWLMERIGYKKGILLGLLTCAVGAFLFIPAASIGLYGFFLFALFVMACGQGVLEVAANPYVTILGPPESSERRLNLAQSFNAVGAVVTPIIGRAFILSGIEYSASQISAMSPEQSATYSAMEASRVRGPYLAITALFSLVAGLLYFARLPEIREVGGEAAALFDSIMFPTVFALGVKNLGIYTKLGSALLVMSIIGGAIVPAVMGYISDASSIQKAFVVPLICYSYVLYFAVRGYQPAVPNEA